MFRQAALSFAFICLSTSGFAGPIQSVVVDGEYVFGPQVSQEEACQQAELRAKEEAIRIQEDFMNLQIHFEVNYIPVF